MLSYIGRQQLCGKLSNDPEYVILPKSSEFGLFGTDTYKNHLEYKYL